MPVVTWDHIHLRSPDPEATAAWLQDVLGGEIIRGPDRLDVQLGGAKVFIAPVASGDGVNAPAASATQARFFTGRYQRRLIPVIGHNVPQEAPAVVAATILELLKA